MDDKVKELVEWVAAKLSGFKDWEGAREHIKEGWRAKAKQILSHPDLALMLNPQYIDWKAEPEKVKLSTLALVFPLAEALKESK